MYKKFGPNDLIYNQIKSHPYISFLIYDRKVIYNDMTNFSGTYGNNINHVPSGYINLYEMNVDRQATQLVYPFITKDGSLTSFKTVSTSEFNNDFAYGDVISSSYPLSASISVDWYEEDSTRTRITSLQNSFEHYRKWSQSYAYSDKSTQELRLISIPSIFYGSSIKKGSVDLKFYITGSLLAEVKDERQNGELIQVGPVGSNGSGSIAGVVLYNEGFLVMTGAWDLSNGNYTDLYIPGAAAVAPKWLHFGHTGSSGVGERILSSSFYMSFQGTTKTPVLTMFAHANKGELNYSNNPTFKKYGQSLTPVVSKDSYKEPNTSSIKNIVKSVYSDMTGSFEKITYISKVGIYDKNKNLIAIAKLATPLRKKETDQYSIKLKLDF